MTDRDTRVPCDKADIDPRLVRKADRDQGKMRVVDNAPVRSDHEAVFGDFRGDLPQTSAQGFPLASPRPARDSVLGAAPMRLYRPA